MSHYKVLVHVCPPTLPKEEVSVNIGFKGEGLHGLLPRTWSIQSKIEMNAQIVFVVKKGHYYQAFGPITAPFSHCKSSNAISHETLLS